MIGHTNRCLNQAIALLDGLDDNQYRTDKQSTGASVGTHMRHVTDHYLQFLNGLGNGVVNYDLRRRDIGLETRRSAMRKLVKDLQQRLDGVVDQPLILQCQLGANPVNGGPEDGGITEIPTSAARELHFLYYHSIHHYAQIATLLRQRQIQMPEHFGVAPATLRHRQQPAT